MNFTRVLEAVLFTEGVWSCMQEQMQSSETLSAEGGRVGGEQEPCTHNLPAQRPERSLQPIWVGEINPKVFVHCPEGESPSYKRIYYIYYNTAT